MRCMKPYVAPGNIAYPCGQCDLCRVARRRIWAHRIMLEALQHEQNSFVTLTYDPKKEPWSLEPDHLRLFLYRLRKALRPGRIRFYAVGEYGDQSFRPHFHMALFGVGCVPYSPWRTCECLTCSTVRETWGLGHVMVGSLEERSAQYICGYVTKKMTSAKDARLGGRHPEFARMSLRPGIGAGAIHDVASVMMQYRLEEKMVDVPTHLAHGGQSRPLGRYLRRKLRVACGLPESAPEEVVEALRQGLLPVFDYARNVTPRGASGVYRSVVEETFAELNEQARRNSNARDLKRRQL